MPAERDPCGDVLQEGWSEHACKSLVSALRTKSNPMTHRKYSAFVKKLSVMSPRATLSLKVSLQFLFERKLYTFGGKSMICSHEIILQRFSK